MPENSKLLLHTLIEKEGDFYSALCLELNVASQGKSIQQAKANLKEAVELYLEDVCEAGDQEEFIPRPASAEEWLKYFRVEAKQLGKQLRKRPFEIEYNELVYV